jgi:DNA-binding transcriptional LysR family regulator
MNRVSTYELECFVAVAEELSFSRAAKKLHLSQPPLSRQIQSLEAKLGMRLLNRNTRTVTLTPAGLLYLEDARQILIQLDSAAASARRATSGEILRLRLAFVGALLDEEFIHLLNTFRESHPQCQIYLTDLPPAEQFAALRIGQFDGAFIGAPPRKLDRRISIVIWKREPLLLAIPESHPLIAKKSIDFGTLQENWVMVSRAAAPAFREQFDGLCESRSLRPRIIRESDRAAAVLTMVAAEQGISLLPESISRLIHRGVVFRPLKGKQPMLEHSFAHRADESHGLIREFLKLFPRKKWN